MKRLSSSFTQKETKVNAQTLGVYGWGTAYPGELMSAPTDRQTDRRTHCSPRVHWGLQAVASGREGLPGQSRVEVSLLHLHLLLLLLRLPAQGLGLPPAFFYCLLIWLVTDTETV